MKEPVHLENSSRVKTFEVEGIDIKQVQNQARRIRISEKFKIKQER